MAETERKSHLPYLAPLARVIPLVYDQSISYYEFLNKLYSAVDEALQTMDEAIEAADKVNTKLDNFRKELDILKKDIEDRMGRAETVVDGFDGRMNILEDAFTQLEGSVNSQISGLSTSLQSLRRAFESERTITDTSMARIANEFGGAFGHDRILKPDITDCPKLYKGPGTLSETTGDIPALAQFIDDAADSLRDDIGENTSRINVLETTMSYVDMFPHFEKMAVPVEVEQNELQNQKYKFTLPYAYIKNRTLMLRMIPSNASQLLANAQNSLSIKNTTTGQIVQNVYLGKNTSSAVTTGITHMPWLRLNFFEGKQGISQDQGVVPQVLHEFNVGAGNGGIHDGIAPLPTTANEVSADTSYEFEITVGVYDHLNESSGELYVYTNLNNIN